MYRASPKCMHTLRIIMKAVLIKIHFIFTTELSAAKVCTHFWGTPGMFWFNPMDI